MGHMELCTKQFTNRQVSAYLVERDGLPAAPPQTILQVK